MLRDADGKIYPFCHPGHGHGLAFLAGTGTGTLGISGAEVHTSALILRCGVATQVAAGTGTGAAAFTLPFAAPIVLGDVAGVFALSGIPGAVIGSLTTSAHGSSDTGEGRLVGVGMLGLLPLLRITVRAVNGI